VLDSRYYRYHSSEPDQGSADPKAYFDEWPENADISGTKEKKLDLATENILHNISEQ